MLCMQCIMSFPSTGVGPFTPGVGQLQPQPENFLGRDTVCQYTQGCFSSICFLPSDWLAIDIR